MSETTSGPAPAPKRGRIVAAALLVAGVALATSLLLFNLGGAGAKDCPVQPEAARLIDAAATGQLAALNGTGNGRGYADLAFQDAAGKPMTIADFKGKKLLVNFWASWCIPCREEMPALDALAAKYNGEAFEVLPINLDVGASGLDKARAFLDEGQWAHLPLYADPTFAAFDRLKTAGVTVGLPASLLLDGNGCELGALQGPAEWDTPDGQRVIEALLGV